MASQGLFSVRRGDDLVFKSPNTADISFCENSPSISVFHDFPDLTFAKPVINGISAYANYPGDIARPKDLFHKEVPPYQIKTNAN